MSSGPSVVTRAPSPLEFLVLGVSSSSEFFRDPSQGFLLSS
jgi:hypothetical protein